jgi:hypothetical protein
MYSKHIILVSMLVFCFILNTSLSSATERSIGKVESTKSVVSSVKKEPKPLQQALVASKLAAPSSYQLLLVTIDNVISSRDDLKNTTGCSYAHIQDILIMDYKNGINNCLTKSYSVQDQQAAGCAGTDTVNQCMDKLYKYCIGGFKGEYGKKEAFTNAFKTELERSSTLNVKSKKYYDQMQTLINNMP